MSTISSTSTAVAASPPFPQQSPAAFVAASQSVAAAAPLGYAMRLSVAAPAGIRPGDQLFAILVSDVGLAWVSNALWSGATIPTRTGLTTLGQMLVCRRTVGDMEPASYTFDAPTSTPAIVAIVAYRGLPDAGVVDSTQNGESPITYPTTPYATTKRATDVVLTGSYQKNDLGIGPTPAVLSSDATFRLDAVWSSGGVNKRRLFLYDFAPRIVGKTSRMHQLAGASDAISFTIVLGAAPTIGAKLSIDLVSPGGIGLPSEGI